MHVCFYILGELEKIHHYHLFRHNTIHENEKFATTNYVDKAENVY